MRGRPLPPDVSTSLGDLPDCPWHALSPDAALERLASSSGGLAQAEAGQRYKCFGSNQLPNPSGTGLLRVFLRQFASPLIYILLVAGVISLGLGQLSDALFIFGVLLLNAVIGTVQEWKAETSAAVLRESLHLLATVIRDGRRQEIDSAQLVPGDVVVLEPGAAVAADIRLLSSRDLKIDESLLTGESTAVAKDAEAKVAAGAVVADRLTSGHAGTTIVAGRGIGVVVATGMQTQLGLIAESLVASTPLPPLVVRLRVFARRIAVAALILIGLLAMGQFANGVPLADIFLLSIALAVAAIPEGLPVAITVALAIASARMSRRNVIVRRLAAVEGLGACTIIASDKTGTLTENQLTITRLVLPDGRRSVVGGQGLEPPGELPPRPELQSDEPSVHSEIVRLAAAGAYGNEAVLAESGDTIVGSGDAVDIAFLILARKLGLERADLLAAEPELHVIPYETEQRFSASIHQRSHQHYAYVKGAPETVLPMCTGLDVEAAQALATKLASEGYRVLAVAEGPVELGALNSKNPTKMGGLQLLGFAGLIDPVRPEVPEAINLCRRAGIDVRMVTGDHPQTALAIARELGIAADADQIATGSDLATLEGPALADRIATARVFARVEPTQKTLIVEVLQRLGHFVAVTGDGVNDAPALRVAHIGVAMGKDGTDVARSAADLIITDDNFASIVNGVEEGRAAYANIRKVIWLLISTGTAEIVIFFLALLSGLPIPLTPVQLLWLNLVTNGVQDVAMAFEGHGRGAMSRPPRSPQEAIFDRRMIEQCVLSGAHMGVLSFLVYGWLLTQGGYAEEAARNLLLLLMVLFENVHVFNCRSEFRSVFRVALSRNPILVTAVLGAQMLHLGAMYVPGLRDVLDVVPPTAIEWLLLLGVALSVVLTSELYKLLRARSVARSLDGVIPSMK